MWGYLLRATQIALSYSLVPSMNTCFVNIYTLQPSAPLLAFYMGRPLPTTETLQIYLIVLSDNVHL